MSLPKSVTSKHMSSNVLAALTCGIISVTAAATAHAGFVFDLQALSGAGGATVTDAKTVSIDPNHAVGSSVVFALVGMSLGNNSLLDEGFQSALSSVLSFAPTGVKNIRGNFSTPVIDPTYLTGAAFAGAVADLNGDGDLDVGGALTGATSVTGSFINVRASSMVNSGSSATDLPGNAGRAFVFGTVTWTITSVDDINSALVTFANFGIPTFASTVFNAQRALYQIDGVNGNGGSAALPKISAGPNVSVQLGIVPEPSVSLLCSLAFGAMGLRRFRR